MGYIFDAGALIALERNDAALWERMKIALANKQVPRTHGGVVGQVWRGRGPRQASLSRALSLIEVVPLDDALGREAGELLNKTKTSDVVDASVVLLAEDHDTIVTSNPDDLTHLAAVAGLEVEILET